MLQLSTFNFQLSTLNLPPVTVLEGIQKSTEFLANRGVDTPRLQAELLLAHQLNMPRMKLYLNFERQLSVEETDGLRDSVRRRGLREPLQHIVGTTSFCGMDLQVTRDVLIPRAETEVLAEAGWTFLAGRTVPGTEPPRALDLGTGSGCLAIAVAVHCPNAEIFASDLSAAALDVARENARRLKVEQRIRFLEGDAFAPLSASGPGQASTAGTLDLIISNPPYIASDEIASLEPEVRDYDPRSALDGGEDGLDFFRRLSKETPAFLKTDGRLMLEFGDGQADALRDLFAKQNWIVDEVRDDYTRRPRILIARLNPSPESAEALSDR